MKLALKSDEVPSLFSDIDICFEGRNALLSRVEIAQGSKP
jgi:hypothetical protein